MAYERKDISLHTRIAIPVASFTHKLFTDEQKDKYLVTTVGKIKFNEILPDSYPYVNEPSDANITGITPDRYFLPMGTDLKTEIAKMPLAEPFVKKTLSKLIAQVFKRYKTTETSVMLDKLKDLGFKYSTVAGISISMNDIIVSDNKQQIIDETQKKVNKINKEFTRGLITEDERYKNVCALWAKATSDISNELQAIAKKNTMNPIFMMMNSGARGSANQFNQLAGMRGLIAKPTGETIEIPIKSNLIEGCNVTEFFIGTRGGRKGIVDTALRTADSGYLTRRLVDVAQDIVVKEEDCGTINGVEVTDFIDERSNTMIEPLIERIIGRYTATKVINPETKEVIIDKNQYITEAIANKIINAGIKSVKIRSVLTCNTVNGVCQHCYGRNLATGNMVETGEAVGIMAAQSIGEPGTQLTMRTFHTGGVAGGDDITQGLPRVQELFEARNPKGKATIAEISGKITNIENLNGKFKITIANDADTKDHITNYDAKLIHEVGDTVKPGDALTTGNINPKELLAVTDPITVQKYILKEVQKVYCSQGVGISDKHVEIIARRMISRMRIVEEGDSRMLLGTLVSINDFTENNKELILEGKMPATGRPVMLGITKAALETDSFLSAASFQETTRILTDAAIKGKVDHLQGLKENVIIGKLIPAGTGAKKYSDVSFDLESDFADEEPLDVLEDKLGE